jgi:hypothetical protein
MKGGPAAKPIRLCRLGVMIDKTQGEYKESAAPSIADMIADIDF